MFNEPYDFQNRFNQNFYGEDINVDVDVMMNGTGQSMNNTMFQGSTNQPIIEPMQERVVNRTIMHEVPHD